MSLLDTIRDNASDQYRAFIEDNRSSVSIGDSTVLYGSQDVEERNATYEVQTYLPGWFAIGDDSGGSALLMRLDGSHAVFRCGHGAIGSIEPETVANSFTEWLKDDCPLPDEDEDFDDG